MGAKLEALRSYQDIELQIVDIRAQLERRQRAVDAQRRKLKKLRDELQAERDAIRRSQMDVDQVDLELKSRTTHLTQLREHLNSAKTNKEYAAILSQLNTEKADATRVEQRALEMMGGIDSRKETLAEREKAEQDEVTRLKELENALARAGEQFADKLADLERQRDEAEKAVDRRSLEVFKRLSERYEGEAMALVDRPNPRREEYVCSGCYLQLTAEVANALLSRDELITCKNCGRILWMHKL